MTISHDFYEVRSYDDGYGLELRSNETTSVSKALDGINRLYRSALERGYDNRHRKWAIVNHKCAKTIDDHGDLIDESSVRIVVARAVFSAPHSAFILL